MTNGQENFILTYTPTGIFATADKPSTPYDTSGNSQGLVLGIGNALADPANTPTSPTNINGGTYNGILTIGGGIKSGQNNYNVGTGFWLGVDGSTPKFSIGDGGVAQYMTWDGSNLNVNGTTVGGLSDTFQYLVATVWEGASTVYNSNTFFSATNTFAYSQYDLFVSNSSSSTAYVKFGQAINLTKNATLETSIKISSVAAQGATKAISYLVITGGDVATLGGGNDGDPGTHFFGFKIYNNSTGTKLYAISKDGSTRKQTDITGSLTLTNYNQMRAVFLAGSSVMYYVNGNLVATHTSSIPNSSNAGVAGQIAGFDSGTVATPTTGKTFTAMRLQVKGVQA